MTYETLTAIIQRTSKAKLRDVISVVEDLYRETETEDDTIESYYKLYDLFDLVLQQPLLEGTESDFHNLTVTCARQDEYDTSCRILDKGLEQFPYSMDLLSDYLSYGMSCGRSKQCKTIFSRLLEQRIAWNWRAYHFSISYLMEAASIDSTINPVDISALISEFQKKIPTREECYIDEADFLNTYSGYITEDRTFLSVLEYATSDDCPIQRTPKCDLRLANYYYDVGKDLGKANQLLERCKRNSVESQLSVNRNYVYLLSALCKMSQYYDVIGNGNSRKVFPGESEKEQSVLAVYEDYHIAALKRSDSRVQSCKNLIESFARETGVPYPYDDDGVESNI